MNKREKQAFIADGALLLCAVMWGGGFVAAKIALGSVTPFYVLALRVLGAGLLLLAIFWKKMRHVEKATLQAGVILGILLLIGQMMQIVALQYTQPGKQAFLVASYTLMIPFVAWIVFKKRPQWPSILAGIIMVFGIGCLSLSSSFTIHFGDGLSILAAMFFAVHMVLIAMMVQKHDSLQLSILQLIFAGVIALVMALCFEPPLHHITTEGVWAVGYLLLINTAVAFSLQVAAQKYTTATRSSIVLSLESLFGMLFSIWLLNEIFTPKMFIGVALIFVALLVSKLERAAR